MKTRCPNCGAPVVRREWITIEPPHFLEAYECGSKHAWGFVAVVVECDGWVVAGWVVACPLARHGWEAQHDDG